MRATICKRGTLFYATVHRGTHSEVVAQNFFCDTGKPGIDFNGHEEHEGDVVLDSYVVDAGDNGERFLNVVEGRVKVLEFLKENDGQSE